MFIRVKDKSTNTCYKKSIQIVENFRESGKVKQRIIKHIGMASNDKELQELRFLAQSIQIRLENENNLSLFTPEELQKELMPLHKDSSKKTLFGKDSGSSISVNSDKSNNTHQDSNSSSISFNNNIGKTDNNNYSSKNKSLITYSDEDYRVDIRELEEESRVITGIHDIYGTLFDELKLKSIFPNAARNVSTVSTFKEIVLARVANPDSKRATVKHLENNFGVSLDLSKVYRMMDNIDEIAINKLNTLAYHRTKELFGGKIDVIYFDATTIYFESFTEDEFKRNGYSKDLKFNQPQVLLALMVTKEGLPIGYETFSGDTFDGHTLIPSLKILREKYNIDKVVYVADSGMFNNSNLEELEKLEEHKFDYIVGARIKNLSKEMKKKITDMDNYKELNSEIKIANFILPNGRKLIVTHSKKRALKDRSDREKGIEKLRRKLESSNSIKDHLSAQGYKKYLLIQKSESAMATTAESTTATNSGDTNKSATTTENSNSDNTKSNTETATTQSNSDNTKSNKNNNTKRTSCCEISITLNESKIEEDSLWDGLKGLVVNANSTLSNEEILTQYNNLWQVEESFRITKHDLKIRPVYHWKPSRIKAHIAISFASFMLTRYLEHRVRVQYKKLSPNVIRNLLLGVQSSILICKKRKIKYALPSKIKKDTQKIYRLMGVERRSTPYIIGKI